MHFVAFETVVWRVREGVPAVQCCDGTHLSTPFPTPFPPLLNRFLHNFSVRATLWTAFCVFVKSRVCAAASVRCNRLCLWTRDPFLWVCVVRMRCCSCFPGGFGVPGACPATSTIRRGRGASRRCRACVGSGVFTSFFLSSSCSSHPASLDICAAAFGAVSGVFDGCF